MNPVMNKFGGLEHMRGFVLVGESPTVPYCGSLSSGVSYDVRNRPRKGGGLSFSFFLSFRPTSRLWIIVILTTRPRIRKVLRSLGIFCVYQTGRNKLIGDPRSNCSCFRRSYNIGSRGFGSLRLVGMSRGSPTPTSE